jgi:hypothetical protein
MAEDETTHVVYQGRHYVLPGKLDPQDAFIRVRNLSSKAGPKLQPLQSGTPAPEGFEDTSAEDAAAREEWRSQFGGEMGAKEMGDLALVASQWGLPGAARGVVGGVKALKGLSSAQKAIRVAKATGKAAAIGTAGATVDEGLRAAGVPPGISQAVVVGALGVGTKPGRAALTAGLKALQGEAAAGAAARRIALGGTAGEASAQEIQQQILRWRTVDKLSGAQIQAALRQTYGIPPPQGREIMTAVLKAEGVPLQTSAAPSAAEFAAARQVPAESLRGPRIEQGAQKVGRAAGLSKEEVRLASGPVLGEAAGEASPILPKQALQSIIDKMKAMPMAEREAYVAKATSGKAKWQIENIRRTLEHLGLLLPVGAAGVAATATE